MPCPVKLSVTSRRNASSGTATVYHKLFYVFAFGDNRKVSEMLILKLIVALIIILIPLLLTIWWVAIFFKNKKAQKHQTMEQRISFSKIYDPADEWSAADWEAYNFHSDCGDR